MKKLYQVYGKNIPNSELERLGIPDFLVDYYLMNAEYDFYMRYRIPTFDRYVDLRQQKQKLKRDVFTSLVVNRQNVLNALEQRHPNKGKIESREINKRHLIEKMQDRMISKRVREGLISGLSKKEIGKILQSFLETEKQEDQAKKMEMYSEIAGELSDEDIAKEYNELRGQTRRKVAIGDDLRHEAPNWGLFLLNGIKDGDFTPSEVSAFTKAFPMHGKFLTTEHVEEEGKKKSSRVGPKAVWWLLSKGYKRFEDLPEEYQKALESHGITSLDEPRRILKAFVRKMMIVQAFNRAMIKMNKLASIGNNLVKTASATNMKNAYQKVAANAIIEIQDDIREIMKF